MYPSSEQHHLAVLIAAACQSLAVSTANSYLSILKKFAIFVEGSDLEDPVIPTSKQVVHQYLADLCFSGVVSPAHFDQHVSALNTLHALLGFSPPIPEADKQHQMIMTGFLKVVITTKPVVEKQPLLITHINNAITSHWAALKVAYMHWLTTAPAGVTFMYTGGALGPARFCADMGVIVGYMCGLRGISVGQITIGDLTVPLASEVVQAYTSKQHPLLLARSASAVFTLSSRVVKQSVKQRRLANWCVPYPDHQPTLSVPAAAPCASWFTGLDESPLVKLHQLLCFLVHHVTESVTSQAAGVCTSDVSLFAPVHPGYASFNLAAMQQLRFTTDDVSTWVVALSGDEHLTAHSMRVGCLSALLAVGVSRDVARVWCKWASPAMVDLYHRVLPPSSLLPLYFGWMRTANIALYDS